ncbi:tRNA methyltransferase-like protein [Pyrenochaeta sp. MPI-SDFR-AT-0127]|nr:tRNA methyltransferase-like protein [Pyrenochaeta sp. MPI-SDFR-AT-0127]
MTFPYQCLVARSASNKGSNEWTVFGASGSRICALSSKGATSTWPEHNACKRDEQSDADCGEPPGKRIKLDNPPKPQANFSNLTLSNDGNYLIGVTGEDKCIRVFQIDSQGRLEQLSERCLSRRPCSITLTADDLTILCADKFGDVYALPLLLSIECERPVTLMDESPGPKDYVPAATALTVHSGRNRKTLEEQLKQSAKGVPKSKEPMKFRHELLLGHVSMLTDIAYAKVNSRGYVITADRDEHIRISRGPPQAHIIEGFCFGHEAFVSKLCLTQSGYLVSGGGDDHLFVWEWQTCRMIEKLPIKDIVLNHLRSRTDINFVMTNEASFRIAISGIWNTPGNSSEILVACEGVPALFGFKVGTSAARGDVIPLDGNALGVAFLQTTGAASIIAVAIDNVHKAGSTTAVRDDEGVSRMQCFSKLGSGEWREDASAHGTLAWFESQGRGNGAGQGSADEKAVRDILYNVENLRKRPGAED